jgi:hypothetical protein
MHFMIEFEAFDTVIEPALVESLRGRAFAFFQQCTADPRVKACGHYTNGRSGFMVVEVGAIEEILSFTGQFLDHVHFEVKPFLPMAQFLENAGKIFGGHG